MTTAQKLVSLRKKLASRNKMLEKNDAKVAKDKARAKALHKEVSDIVEEIAQLEVKALSETLNTSGITAADVQEAIAAGLIKPSTTDKGKEQDGATYNTVTSADSTKEADVKENTNEISDS